MDDKKVADKKEWYKSGWGLAVAIIFLPFFAIWYVWSKTNWDNKYKWIATAVITIIVISISTTNDGVKEKETNNIPKTTPVVTSQDKAKVDEDAAAKLAAENEAKAKTEAEAEAKRIAEEEARKPIFDIPSLIGKNVDEIKSVLGAPTDDKEPTKQQLSIGIDIWDKAFEKNGQSLLVTYNPKTRVVADLFMDGSDKNKLLQMGGLSEKNDKYVTEYVTSIQSPSEVTGIKIAKKLADIPDANVTYNAVAFKIENSEDYNWTNCKYKINYKYEYQSSDGIKAKDSVIIPYSEFTKNNTRFNILDTKIDNLYISCDAGLQKQRWGEFKIGS